MTPMYSDIRTMSMLYTYLNGAISDLNSLIKLTELDNADIQVANHEAIFERIEQKDILVKEFENKKTLIHQEMLALREKNPQKPLEELLDDEASTLLDSMRDSLESLKTINAHYARSVFAVSEFYDSLIQRIIPHEHNGYENHKPQSHILKIQA